MNYVEPIRSKVKIQEMKEELKKRGTRDYLLFIIGINTGLRISDIIKLKVSDLMTEEKSVKLHIDIIEKKTEKRKRFRINNIVAEEIRIYAKNMKDTDFIFKSRKGNKPITRIQAYRILNEVAKNIGLKEIGTHTLRKTFGYHFYYENKDIAMLQKLFNHSSASITLRYIGIAQDEIDEAYENFKL